MRGKGGAALFLNNCWHLHAWAALVASICVTWREMKNCQKSRTRSCAYSPWTVNFLLHDRGRRGLMTKPASCRCLGPCASPPLALPAASRQPDISSEPFKEMSFQESGSRVAAFRVSDSPSQLNVSPEEDEKTERTCQSNSVYQKLRNSPCRKVRSGPG